MAHPLHLVEEPTPAILQPRLDDFGFDREFTKLFQPLAEWLYARTSRERGPHRFNTAFADVCSTISTLPSAGR